MKVGITLIIRIIAVGNIKEVYLIKGIKHYLAKLVGKINLEIIEIGEERLHRKPSEADIANALSSEGSKIINQLLPNSFILVLDIAGKAISKTVFTRILKRELYQNKRNITFIIGSSHGLSRKVLSKAHQKISFGKMTFPHQLMRLILVEQLSSIFNQS